MNVVRGVTDLMRVKPRGQAEMSMKEWFAKAEWPATLVFGERHLQPSILDGQMAVLSALVEKSSKTALVVEYFAFDHQNILDAWMKSVDGIDKLAHALSTADPPYEEGFDLQFYGKLFLHARKLNVPLFAGFVPRSVARLAIGSDKPDVAQKLRDEIQKRYQFDVDKFFFNKPGSAAHLNWFEAMIRGEAFRRNSPLEIEAGSKMRIFPAQLIKDAALAWKTSQLQKQYEHVLVCCGCGHSDYHFGAPERTDTKPFVISPRTRHELDQLDDDHDGNSGDLLFIYNHSDE